MSRHRLLPVLEPRRRPARPMGMTSTVLARRGALTGAVLISGCLLLSACSGNSTATSAAAGAPIAATVHGAAATANGLSRKFAQAGHQAVQTAKLAPASQSIIYTASLTVRTANVTAAAQRAIGMVVAVGGYTADEQAAS